MRVFGTKQGGLGDASRHTSAKKLGLRPQTVVKSHSMLLTAKRQLKPMSKTMIAVFALAAIAVCLSVQQADAVQTSWYWAVDPSCLVGTTYKCNTPAGLDTSVGIPDLAEAIPQHIGLQNTNQNSYLRVSTAVANIGTGQWQMRSVVPPTQDQPQLAMQQLLNDNGVSEFNAIVSSFQYHPAHKHFHIAAVTSYELFTADGSTDTDPSNNISTGISSQKVTSCLIDWVKIADNAPSHERAYWDCFGELQGVSPGWMDQYHHSLAGQELNVTNLPTVYYFLVLTANPERNFIDSDFENNQSWTLYYSPGLFVLKVRLDIVVLWVCC